MPWGRTWSEELVAEWLELEGFLVTIGLKVGTGKGGGRMEADVVGARIRGSNLEIMHVEIGALYESARNIVKIVAQKFDSSRVDVVKNYFLQLLGFKGHRIKYDKLYVLTASRKDKKNINDMLAPHGVKFWDIDDLVEKIEQSINSWVQTHKTPQNPYPSLPESYWMLQLFKVIATQQ
jgi:hypothetical protein